MHLIIYKKADYNERALKSQVRFVTFHRLYVCFNVCVTQELQMQTGQRVLFAQDTDTGHWYFAFGFDLSDGNKIRAYSVNKNCMRCSNKRVADILCHQHNTESVTFGIAKTPKVIDGLKWYKILTTTPIRVK